MNNQVYFFHGKTRPSYTGKGGTLGSRFTLALLFLDGTIEAGISICSHKDQFIKKIGRAKAEGRVRKKTPFCGKAPVQVVTGLISAVEDGKWNGASEGEKTRNLGLVLCKYTKAEVLAKFGLDEETQRIIRNKDILAEVMPDHVKGGDFKETFNEIINRIPR